MVYALSFAGEWWIPETMEELYNPKKEGFTFPGRPFDWDQTPLWEDMEDEHGASRHMTMVFNAFVWLQIFNFIGSRRINDEKNIFEGLFSNAIFLIIWVVVAAL